MNQSESEKGDQAEIEVEDERGNENRVMVYQRREEAKERKRMRKSVESQSEMRTEIGGRRVKWEGTAKETHMQAQRSQTEGPRQDR